MAMEISVISVGIVLLVLLLLLLIYIYGQRDKSIQEAHKGSKLTGNYLLLVDLYFKMCVVQTIILIS